MFGSYVNLFRATWSGKIGPSSEEIFSFTRHVAAVDLTTSFDVVNALAGDITNLLAEATTGSTPFSNIGQTFPTHVLFDLLTVWDVDEITGAADPLSRQDRGLTDAGLGATSQGLPYQVSLGVTMRTAARGRRERNRFYLPPQTSTATDGHGRMLPTLVDDIQTQLRFQLLAHRADDGMEYCIYSPADSLAKEISDFYTGDVMDSIRRRRNALVETRHVLAV